MPGLYTVNSLIKALQKQQAKGNGNKYVIVSSDDEGNDYRCLLEQDILDNIDDIEEYIYVYEVSVYQDLNDCIVL